MRNRGIHRLLTFAAGLIAVLATGVTVKAQPAPGPSVPVAVRFDHALVCVSDLAAVRQGFASVGLTSDYGGPHPGAVTQMALVGFPDGTYIGLMSPIKPPAPAGADWAKSMNENIGSCAWAAYVPDIKSAVARFSRLGIKVTGPAPGARKRPDGVLIKWERANLGRGEPGALLPFLIQDITPRSYRKHVSASTKGTDLMGVKMVVLGVKNLDSGIALFRRVYNWPAPEVEAEPRFGAKLAYFKGTSVILGAPLAPHSWLAARLARFGDCPIGFLMGTSNFQATASRFSLPAAMQWFGWKVSWFDPHKLDGVRLGIIGR
ncbi:MAG TPA: VOC family protein [Terriglobia bacterium]|nr:VOC family protein [Terriglobia bacterium]